jgi:hypothetical protein
MNSTGKDYTIVILLFIFLDIKDLSLTLPGGLTEFPKRLYIHFIACVAFFAYIVLSS